ncbi:ATP-dependent Clp protease ATP-binding subunit [candidate division WWE3 bacterium]|nr:ATP-dependent Clp protease ATP-binding subunit [candidate division WWE3 bacterium]
MITLPVDLVRFGSWILATAPVRIAKIFGRIIILVNNEASFILNLKMLFVPLFGDYTWVGRLMGFVYRTIKIILGLLIILFLFLLGIVVFLGWYILPIYLLAETKLLILPFILALFSYWKIVTHNVPVLKIRHITGDNYLQSFRPEARHALENLIKYPKTHYYRFFLHPDIVLLLTKLEVLGNNFVEDVIALGLDHTSLKANTFNFAKEMNVRYVELEHLFLGILSLVPDPDRFLSKYELTMQTCTDAVSWIVNERERLSKIFFWQEDYQVPIMGGVNRGMTGRVTPILDSVGTDFTEQAQLGYIKNIRGHKKETKDLVDMLGNSDMVNVLIVGPPGSGKTSIVKGIAMEIINGTTENSLQYKRIVSVETSALIAGASTAGDFAGRLKRIMDDVEGSGDIILFFDEIHNLVAADAKEGSTVFSLLEPYFSSNRFQVIGATNLENYRKFIEPNGSFARLFRTVEIGETNPEETLDILEGAAYNFEKDYGVKITYPALQKTIFLSKKLIHERVFPDKALDILGRAVLLVRKNKSVVSGADVADVISELTHIPVSVVSESESQKLLNIENELRKRVIGQDKALEQIGKAMKRGRAGIRSETKPIASFLFVGTTGVGKTETAKALAAYYFGSEKVMIRMDMSEYQQQDSLSRLIGAPDGSSKGILTEAVRKNPFSMILLDEIEKANPQILLAFLQVLDDGRLTDSSGTVVDFTNTIIISTSNVGTRAIQIEAEKGADFETINTVVMAEVRVHFAPEFLNRYSGIIVFRPLSADDFRKIVGIMLTRVQRVSEEKGIRVSFKPELIDELLKRGFTREWGARPLARVIEDSVETYIAIKLLSNELVRGDEINLGTEVFTD